jgi:hypothetical protein
MATFKVVNLAVKSVVGLICSTPLKLGNWFASLDLMVTSLDDHAVVLGQDFLNISKEILVLHESILVFLNKAKMLSVPMLTRRKLGWMPRMSMVRLIEADIGPTDRPHVIAQK